MYSDAFAHTADSPIAPAERCFAVQPSDVNDLPQATKALYIGEGGDIALVPVKGTTPVLFRNLPAGAVLDVRVKAVKATGTTAADIVGLA